HYDSHLSICTSSYYFIRRYDKIQQTSYNLHKVLLFSKNEKMINLLDLQVPMLDNWMFHLPTPDALQPQSLYNPKWPLLLSFGYFLKVTINDEGVETIPGSLYYL